MPKFACVNGGRVEVVHRGWSKEGGVRFQQQHNKGQDERRQHINDQERKRQDDQTRRRRRAQQQPRGPGVITERPKSSRVPNLLQRAERYIQVKEYHDRQEKQVFDPFTGDFVSDQQWVDIEEEIRQKELELQQLEMHQKLASSKRRKKNKRKGQKRGQCQATMSQSAPVLSHALPVRAYCFLSRVPSACVANSRSNTYTFVAGACAPTPTANPRRKSPPTSLFGSDLYTPQQQRQGQGQKQKQKQKQIQVQGQRW